jgi:hypothetical protein
MVEQKPSKLTTRVRFPSPAPRTGSPGDCRAWSARAKASGDTDVDVLERTSEASGDTDLAGGRFEIGARGAIAERRRNRPAGGKPSMERTSEARSDTRVAVRGPAKGWSARSSGQHKRGRPDWGAVDLAGARLHLARLLTMLADSPTGFAWQFFRRGGRVVKGSRL